MMWLFGIVVVLVLGGIAAVAAGRGGAMAEAEQDRPPVDLPPDGPVGGHDLRRVRFPLAVRGYRMADVDALLARLADQLEDGHDAARPAGTRDAETTIPRRSDVSEPE